MHFEDENRFNNIYNLYTEMRKDVTVDKNGEAKKIQPLAVDIMYLLYFENSKRHR